MKYLFLIDLSPKHKLNWYFRLLKKELKKRNNSEFHFIFAKPDSYKIADYVKKRKQIEKNYDLFNSNNIIVCFGKTSRIFNPKFESPPFGHLKIRIYDIDDSKKINLIPTDRYVEIFTVPSIVNFVSEDAAYNFFDILKWISIITRLDISEKHLVSIINESDIIYYSHFYCEFENIKFVNPEVDEFSDEKINEILQQIPNNSFIAIDLEWFPARDRKRKSSNTEWYNLDNEIVFLMTLCFRAKNNKIFVYSFFYPYYREKILKLFKLLIQNKNPVFVGLNINTDLKFLFRDCEDFFYELFKSTAAFSKFKIRDLRDYVIEKDNSQVKEIGLKDLSAYYLYEYPFGIDYSEIHKIGKQSILENKISSEIILNYAVKDALLGLRLAEYFDKNLSLDRKFFIEYLSRINLLMLYMSFRGIKINLKKLKKFNKVADEVLEKFKTEFNKFGITNPNSIKQIQSFLSKFEEANYIFPRTSKSNLISVRVSYLLENYFKLRQKVKNEDLLKFLDLYFKYKILMHLKTTFLNIDDFADKKGFIHPDYSSHRIVTGRIVSTNPCIQQLPTEKTAQRKLGGIIEFPEYVKISAIKEEILEPEKDNIFIFVDFSQADIRIGQIISNDRNLYEFFSKAGYEEIFKKFFGRSYKNDFEKNLIKSIVLGFLYGISEYGISATLALMSASMDGQLKEICENPVSRFEFAKKIKKTLSEMFSEYNNYLRLVYYSVLKLKKIELFRRRYFNSIRNFNSKIYDKEFWKFAFRRLINSAYNFSIQGLTNDVMNNFVYYAWLNALKENLDVHLVSIIYDECIFEVNKKDKDKFLKILEENFKWDFNRDFEKYLFDRIKKILNLKELKPLPMLIKIKEAKYNE